MEERSPLKETFKEGLRWVIFFGISWIVTATLAQLDLVPEFAQIKIWVFAYNIPIRLGLQFILTAAGRMADKYVYTITKNDPLTRTKGILPF